MITPFTTIIPVFNKLVKRREKYGDEGRAAARGVAFLRKKLRKNLFGKGFLPPNGDGANMAGPIFEGRAQYLPKAKTVSGLRFFCEPIYLWAGESPSVWGELQIGICRGGSY